jgi:formylglycine-generating enzyme required for sulfatase activity
MKEWITPIAVVLGLVTAGFVVRSMILKSKAPDNDDSTDLLADSLGGGPREEVEDPLIAKPEPGTEKLEESSGEGWEDTHHPFVGYPAEPAAKADIMIKDAPAKREFPVDGTVLIPASDFERGDPDLVYSAPMRRLHVKAFMIDRYEVTNAQYKKFVVEAEHRQPALKDEWAKHYSWRESEFPKGTGDHPVTLVDLRDAAKYCKWAGKRLPTGVEWERAARGPKGLKYPWGNDWNGTRAHTVERFTGAMTTEADWKKVLDSGADDDMVQPLPVGSYPGDKTAEGVFDMHGNVSEWVHESFDPYEGADKTSSPLYAQKHIYAVRGNSHANRDYAAPMAIRYPYPRSHQDSTVGFRCAKTP